LFDESTNDLLDKVISGNIGIDFKNLIDLGLVLIRQQYNNSNIFFLELFLKANCLNRDGSLLKCSEFERTCSKIIYFCKLTLAFSIHYSNGEHTSSLISESRELLISPFLSFVSVCGLKALAKSFNDCNNNVPKLVCGKEENEVWCNGESISITEIRIVYKNCLVDLEKLIKKLLFEQNFSDIKVQDNWNNLSIGYGMSFSCEKEEDFSCSLINYVLKNSNFFVENSFIPESKALHNFRMIHDKFMSILICAMHIGGGMPARATELESIQVINSDLIRNIFFAKDDCVFTLIEYSKTGKLTLANSGIARFYDVRLSAILKQYILIVRPFMLVILHSTDLETSNLLKLFSFLDVEFTADEIRNSFRLGCASESATGF
jgi:hypothetical protein